MFRKLLEAQDLGANISQWQAAGRLGMRPATADLALKNARKIPRRQLVTGLRALYDADSQLKSASKNDRAVMEFLVAQLTRVVPGIPGGRGGNTFGGQKRLIASKNGWSAPRLLFENGAQKIMRLRKRSARGANGTQVTGGICIGLPCFSRARLW